MAYVQGGLISIRAQLEESEKRNLSPFATLSKKSRGRQSKIKECPFRTVFERDRDRIIHSKAFRRLKHKTQVFISPASDHYRTRLTHTLEVAQIARGIARTLKLNEYLTEAIALGHDLGHTPFGHSGEAVLNVCVSGGFRHNEQSLRIVDALEKLNLTWEVRDGILNHCGKLMPKTMEGKVVHISDRIAYINHDIDDSLRAKIIVQKDLPKKARQILGGTHSQRIHHMIADIIENSIGKSTIKMSKKIYQATTALRQFLFDKVYLSPRAKDDERKTSFLIRTLFDYYRQNPDKLPEHKPKKKTEIEKSIVDFIAGMTDRYAIKLFSDLFIPSPWMG